MKKSILIAPILATLFLSAALVQYAQGQEAECLATALMSEASIGSYEERVAVAWTIFNRVNSPDFPDTVCDVVYQRGQYATNQMPTQEILDLAESLIADPGISGYVTLNGIPGTWQFTIFKEGYQPVSWSQEITETDTKDAFFS